MSQDALSAAARAYDAACEHAREAYKAYSSLDAGYTAADRSAHYARACEAGLAQTRALETLGRVARAWVKAGH